VSLLCIGRPLSEWPTEVSMSGLDALYISEMEFMDQPIDHKRAVRPLLSSLQRTLENFKFE
jgi:hypothetical protein